MNVTEIKQGYYDFIEEMESKIGKSDSKLIQLQTDSNKELIIVEWRANPKHEYSPLMNVTSFILDEKVYKQALGLKIFKEDQLLSKFAHIFSIHGTEGNNPFNLKVYKIDDNNPYAKFITNCFSNVRKDTTKELFKFLKGLIDDQSRSDTYNSTFNDFKGYLPTKPFITQPSYAVNFTNEQRQKYNDLINRCISKLEEYVNDKMEQLKGGGYRSKLNNIHLKFSDLGKLNVVATVKYNTCPSDDLCYFSTAKEEKVHLSFISQDYQLYPYVKKHYPQYSDKYFSNIVFIDNLSPEFRFMTKSIIKDYEIGDGNKQHPYMRRPTARYIIDVWDLQQWNYKERSFKSKELLTRYLELLMNNPRYKEEYDIELSQQHVGVTHSTPRVIDTIDQKFKKDYIDTIDKVISVAMPLLEEGMDHSVEKQMKDNKEITSYICVGAWTKCESEKRYVKIYLDDNGLIVIPQEDIQAPCWSQNNYTIAIDDSIFNFLYRCTEYRCRSSISNFATYLKGLIDSPKCNEEYAIYKKEYQAKLEEQTTKLSTNSSNVTVSMRDSIKKITEANKRLNFTTSTSGTYLPIDQSSNSGVSALPDSSSSAVSTMLPPVMHQAVFFTWLAYMLSPVINPVFNYISNKIIGPNHIDDREKKKELSDKPSSNITEVKKSQLDKKSIAK